MRSNDGVAGVSVAGAITATLPRTSIFPSVEDVSTFFERGSLGYSATREPGRYDGLELKCIDWQVTPLDVDHVSSSYFEDENTFPSGSVTFDCALLMRDIQHEWRGREGICCPANTTK